MKELRLQRIRPGPDRDAWLPLLLLADESEPEVHSYYQRGDLYGLLDGDDRRVGMVLVVAAGRRVAELKSVAIDEVQQGRGIGRALIAAVLSELRAAGARRAVVGTSNAGIGQLAFYQKCGFRLSHVERDFFNEAKGYGPDSMENGIRHRDMVWLDQDL